MSEFKESNFNKPTNDDDSVSEPVLDPQLESEEDAPEQLGLKFNEDYSEFTNYLKEKIEKDPSVKFTIMADWVSKQKARQAKAIIESRIGKYIDSFTIRATKEQYQEDVNAFQSGIKWEEV